MTFENRRPDAQALLREMTDQAAMDQQNAGHGEGQSRQQRNKACWTKPTPGVIKINVDAPWNATSRLGGIGVVARDHTWRLCGGTNAHLSGDSVEELEAAVVVQWVLLAVDRGWTRVQVESDLETIIKHLLGASFTWRIETLLSHARVLVSSLSNVTWVAISRSTKCSADCIAKLALLRVCPLN